MKYATHKISALVLAIISSQTIGLEAMNDSSMSAITGQSGITINQQTESFGASEISYSDNGGTLQFINPLFTAADGNTTFDTDTTIDIGADGTMVLNSVSGIRDFSMDGISLLGDSDNFFGMNGTYSSNMKLSIGADASGNIDLSGSEFGYNFDRLTFSDGNYDWILTDFALSVLVNYGRLVVDPAGVLVDLGTESNRGLHVDYGFSGVGLGLGTNPFDGNGDLNQAFGSLNLSFDAYGDLTIGGGGYNGDVQGITFIPGLTLVNDDGAATPAFVYSDDGFIILAEDFSGTFSSTNGFTLDIESDVESPYLALRYSDFDFAFSLDNFVLGGTLADYQNGLSKKMGSFKGEFHFRDGTVEKLAWNNGVATPYTEAQQNYMKFRAGGLEGDGITADVSWNLISDDPVSETDTQGTYNRPGDLNTYVAMNDNGNWVFFNGFNSWGQGRAYIDITKQSDNPGTNGLYSDNYDGYFDGLRITLENIKGSYRFSGVTVGTSEAEAKSAPLMGGTELLLALEVFPAYDFTLNGAVTIAPGDINATDPNDRQGITLNGDLYVSDANAALTVDEYGKGVWLTNVNYDLHTRGGSLTVTDKGLTFNKGLTWSTIDVGDIKFGSKIDGQSLGSFKLERLEDGTTISVASGGAGQVCIGGNLNGTGSNCSDSNGDNIIDEQDGVYIDRGDQGLNIKVKAIFAEDNGSDPRYTGKGNRFSWTQPNGTTLALENFSTSDGPGSNDGSGFQTNDYGLNIDLAVDVAPTIVRNQNGDLIQDDALGFAVFGRIHFKQLNIDGLTLAATPDLVATPAQTLIQSIVVQNADIQANLTATPIR